MPRQEFILEIVPYVYDDEDGDDYCESYIPRPPEQLWSKRFRTSEWAVKRAIRTIKHQLQPGRIIDPDFHLYALSDGVRTEVKLPHVYIGEHTLGVPKLMARVKYTVQYR